ncbi:hypothetical protein [Sphingobacterium sp. UT-1RO-CII-1]|uniref:hypothetical protein n=1 Tax=Sphingobacterium sp. UT-1RO-CII-1 TaxID=2995225 RepID=UPI00227B4D8A|nr:hypothetical protein [Sphingobacterium sp. UT-1RO-CII-1]
MTTSVGLLAHSVHLFRKGEHYVAFTNHLVTKREHIAEKGDRFLVQSDWIVL